MAQRLRTDWVLFFTVLSMVCFGLVMVYSTSMVAHSDGQPGSESWTLFARQFAWAIVSLLVLFYATKQDYRKWNHPMSAFLCLGVVVLLLVVVYALDSRSHRWLRLGGLSVQPSEFAKPALALFLAFFLSRRLGAINHRSTLAPLILSTCAMATFVALSDLGTAVVLVATTVMVVYVAGLDYKYLALTMVIGLGAGCVFVAMKPYRLIRVINFVDPQHHMLDRLDPGHRIQGYAEETNGAIDTGYQQKQARIAVGSGGVMGVGLMQSRQKMRFLPKPYTDMIYAVVGEETGFVGASMLLAGFGIVLWRGLRVYRSAADDFGRYLALTATICVIVQALINISVALDLGPTKGIPLPFISYGGSSLMSTLLLMGMLMSVSERAG
jgi:cell division protein FtsW